MKMIEPITEMPTWVAILLLIFGLVVLAIGFAWNRLGTEEVKKRFRLAKMAVLGKDYTQPRMDPGGWVMKEFEEPGHAKDPVLAMLVRSSKAEITWFALHHLLDQWEAQWKHEMVLNPDEERYVSRFLSDKYREAQHDARNAIESRLELTTFEEEDGFTTRYVIEDPATGYRQQISMSERDVLRFDPSPENLPPAVQNRVDRFGDHLLQQIEAESGLQPRM